MCGTQWTDCQFSNFFAIGSVLESLIATTVSPLAIDKVFANLYFKQFSTPLLPNHLALLYPEILNRLLELSIMRYVAFMHRDIDACRYDLEYLLKTMQEWSRYKVRPILVFPTCIYADSSPLQILTDYFAYRFHDRSLAGQQNRILLNVMDASLRELFETYSPTVPATLDLHPRPGCSNCPFVLGHCNVRCQLFDHSRQDASSPIAYSFEHHRCQINNNFPFPTTILGDLPPSQPDEMPDVVAAPTGDSTAWSAPASLPSLVPITPPPSESSSGPAPVASGMDSMVPEATSIPSDPTFTSAFPVTPYVDPPSGISSENPSGPPPSAAASVDLSTLSPMNLVSEVPLPEPPVPASPTMWELNRVASPRSPSYSPTQAAPYSTPPHSEPVGSPDFIRFPPPTPPSVIDSSLSPEPEPKFIDRQIGIPSRRCSLCNRPTVDEMRCICRRRYNRDTPFGVLNHEDEEIDELASDSSMSPPPAGDSDFASSTALPVYSDVVGQPSPEDSIIANLGGEEYDPSPPTPKPSANPLPSDTGSTSATSVQILGIGIPYQSRPAEPSTTAPRSSMLLVANDCPDHGRTIERWFLE